MADSIERIYRLTVEADQAYAQMKKIASSADDIQKQFDAVGKTLKTVFAGLSVASVIQGFRSIVDEADKIGKSAEKFGIATDTLQTLGYAAKASGSDFDTLAAGLQNLNKQLVDVDKGTDVASKALRALGVSGADSPEEAFRKIAAGLSSIPDGAQKTAAALAIFGRNAAQLIPLLNEGADGIAALEEKARDLGVVMDGDAIAASTAFNDSLDDMSTAIRGIFRQITVGLLPAVSGMSTELAKSAKASDDWQSFGRGLATVLKAVAIVAVNVAYVFNAVGKEIGGIAAQAVALAHLDFAGAAEIGRQMTMDAEQSKKDIDDLTSRIWNLDTGMKSVAATADKANPELSKLLKSALATQDAITKSKQEKAQKTPLELFVENAIKAQQEADLLQPKLDKLQELFFRGDIQEPVFEKLKESLGVMPDKIEEVIDPLDTYTQSVKDAQIESDLWADKLARLEELNNAGALSVGVYKDELAKLGISMKEIGSADAADGIKEMNQAIANGLQQGVSGLVDLIVDADQSFQEFAANFLKSIAKMILQFTILKALKSSSTFGSFFASAHGNAFSGATGLPHGVYPAGHPMYFPMGASNAPLNRFAHGGTIGVLAEGSNAEAIVPLMNHGGDLGVKASPVNIEINNTMADTAKVDVAETNKPDGSKQISLTIRREIRAAMSDGTLDNTMRGNYGLSRKAVR